MSDPFKSSIGQQIFEALLPAVYRNRDEAGDLKNYLDGCGILLDQVRHTLDQRLADCFPDNPETGAACQEWLIPYFARLVDARLVSPEARGRRDEVARAIGWRQRKGTLQCVEEIVESVGQMEAEIQEGWKRVARTPFIGMPVQAAATVDMRKPSRAIRSDTEREDEQLPTFLDERTSWRQLNPPGAPCFPESYEDVSPRTVDMRTPDWRKGRYHPKRLLVHVPVPDGFFSVGQLRRAWGASQTSVEKIIAVSNDETRILYEGLTEQPLIIDLEDEITLNDGKIYAFKNVVLKGKIIVESGCLELHQVAAKEIIVAAAGVQMPALVASDSLLDSITVNKGMARLEYCTVMQSASCNNLLHASDCIFAGTLAGSLKPGTDKGEEPKLVNCVRYSQLPKNLDECVSCLLHVEDAKLKTNTQMSPVFFEKVHCDEGGNAVMRKPDFGEPGYGVLHPATPEPIRFGAEDGGEMGAYHHRHYCLRAEAVLDKLKQFLPVNLEPVLIFDDRLNRTPPTTTGEEA